MSISNEPKRVIRIASDADALAHAAAGEFVRSAARAVKLSGRFTVALAGGSTPRGMYRLLAEDPGLRDEVTWGAVHLFWGDERHVPPDHPDSNYRMAYETMIARVPIPDANVHRIRSEWPDPEQIATEYETELRSFFRERPESVPRFDLVVLGLGADAHTASLFPGTRALGEHHRLVVPNWPAGSQKARITMTPPLLNRAADLHFLVSGAAKAEAVAAVLEGPRDVNHWPAQVVEPSNGRVVWLLDRDAAGRLSESLTGEAEH